MGVVSGLYEAAMSKGLMGCSNSIAPHIVRPRRLARPYLCDGMGLPFGSILDAGKMRLERERGFCPTHLPLSNGSLTNEEYVRPAPAATPRGSYVSADLCKISCMRLSSP